MVTSVSNVLDAARGDLMLRILGSSRHGQVVQVHSPKCTIGAGPRCTIRLRARGLYPVHCLILRGANQTIIRRWAPDTLLNGQTFADAVLAPGDRLSIGRLQFEVLAGEPALPPPAPAAGALPVLSPAEDPPAVTAALQTRLGAAQQAGRQRVRRLVAQLRAVRKQLAESQEAQSWLTQAEAHARSEVADRDRQVEELSGQLQTRERELTHQLEQLRSDLAKLEQQRHDWERQHLQHIQQCTETVQAEEKNRQRVAELEARHQQLQSDYEALRQKQAEWDLASAESSTSHQEQAQELERQEAALRAERDALEEARRSWQAAQAQARQHADEQAASVRTQNRARMAERMSDMKGLSKRGLLNQQNPCLS